MSDAPSQPQKKDPCPFVIVQQSPGQYWVSANLAQLDNFAPWTATFVTWLRHRTADETVIFDFHTGSGFADGRMESYLTVLNAIYTTTATTVAEVNHMAQDIVPYAYLVCSQWHVSPFAALLILSPHSDSVSEAERRSFMRFLIEKAEEDNIITADQLHKLLSGVDQIIRFDQLSTCGRIPA